MVKLWRVFVMILALGPLLQASARAGAAPLRQAGETPSPTPPPQAAVLAPRSGQALQGSVPIEIGLAGAGYQTVEVSFAYANNPLEAWFPLYQGNLPQGDLAADPTALQNPIHTWDTSTITDGDYTLRVVFTRFDRTTQVIDVIGLRVRNYTPIETDTPVPNPTAPQPAAPDRPATQTAAVAASPTPIPTGLGPEQTAAALEAAATPTPTPTPLPPALPFSQANPLEMAPREVLNSLTEGALVTTGMFAAGGLYVLARRRRKDYHV